MSGFFISKRGLWLAAGGALGVLAAIGIGNLSKRMSPAAVGVTKEGLAFKEWLIAHYEKVKEDREDIVAESKHAQQKDLHKTSETAGKEEDILTKVEQLVEEALKQKAEKEGA